jgi:hypothetical protein
MEIFSLRVPLASHGKAMNYLGLLVELFVVHLDDGTWEHKISPPTPPSVLREKLREGVSQ